MGRMAAGALALSLAAGAWAEERFIVPRPDGWKLAFRTIQPKIAMTEFVPASQSVEQWTEMVTSQTFVGTKDVPVDGYLQRIAAEAAKVCDDVMVTPIRAGTHNGYQAAFMAQFCTRYAKTGKGEITLYKVIQGRESLYVAYRSWRGPPFTRDVQPVPKADFDAWVEYLNGVLVCDTADSQRPCPR
jgi:hypothetical protein